jgi:SulP family sulfate permease
VSPNPESAASGLRQITPAWLRDYKASDLVRDGIAGATLAAYLLPAAIGDATLAGLPPEAGLYACVFGGLVFWAFCGGRHTAITVTSAISLLVGSSLGGLAGGDPARYAALAAGTGVLVAVMAFLTWLTRAGNITDFISETVLVGFKAGVALYLASTQLPKLFGFKGSHGDFWDRMGHFLSHLSETNPVALTLGVGSLVALLLGKALLPNRPVTIVVLVTGIVLASVYDLAGRGVSVLGAVPQGLPVPALPALNREDVNALLPLALACFLLAAVETAAIGRMFARKHGYRLDSNRDFLALAAANLGAGLGAGYPVSGGMSQSLVNDSGGARTPLSGLVAALLTLVIALFFTHLLYNLPQPVLAAIILVAVTGLVKVDAMKRIWHFGRSEALIAGAALLGVLGSGLLRGVLVGAILSVLMLLRKASRPHTAVLGRVPGTELFGDVERHPDNQRMPGVLVFRVDSSILYFNTQHVQDQFEAALAREETPVRLVVWYFGTTPYVDLAGAELVAEIESGLARRGIALRVSDARGPLREVLQTAGLEARVGPIQPATSVLSVIRDWEVSAAAAAAGGRSSS